MIVNMVTSGNILLWHDAKAVKNCFILPSSTSSSILLLLGSRSDGCVVGGGSTQHITQKWQRQVAAHRTILSSASVVSWVQSKEERKKAELRNLLPMSGKLKTSHLFFRTTQKNDHLDAIPHYN